MKTSNSALLGVAAALILLPSRTPAERPASPSAHTGAPVCLKSAGDNLKPCVALRPAGGVYVSWTQHKGEKTAILFARSQDGVHVDAPVSLSVPSTQLDLGAEAGPNVAVDGKGVIYVAWAAGPSPSASAAAPAQEGSRPAGNGTNSGALTSASARVDSLDASKTAGSSASHSGEAHSHSDAGHAAAGHAAAGHSGTHYGQPTDIWIARSDDDGKSFTRPIQVNDDPPGTVHRFPFLSIDAQGGICVSWLDKRKKTAAGADLTRVFFARSTDGGRTFGKNVDATSGQVYPICHCCRVASVSDPKQGLMIAFRNDVNDLRDMFLVQSTDFGKSFSAPTPLEHTGWMISYCPMDGPSLGIDPSGNLHAVWMSGAKMTAKPLFAGSVGDSKVLYNRVAPGFAKAGEPLLLGEGHHPRLAVGPSGEAYVLWHDNASVLLARLGPGAHDAPQRVQIGDEKGVSSYPSLALGTDGVVYCAWQETQPDDTSQIYLSRVPASAFAGK